jgi:hypothetical protein
MSLVARGVKAVPARVVFNATVMTYLDMSNIPKTLSKLFGVAKANGGFGLWNGGSWYAQTHMDPPEVVTDFIISGEGKFSEFGSAGMTDKMIKLISDQHGIEVSLLMGERAKMVGENILSCIGPSKYGNRRRANTKLNLDRANNIKLTRLRLAWLNSSANSMAYSAAIELNRQLMNPQELRGSYFKTPREVVLEAVSHAGVLNESIAAIAYGTTSQVGLYKKLTNKPSQDRDSAMIRNLWRKGEEAAVLFCKGKISAVFWSFDERLSPDVAAVVQKWAIRAVAEAGPSVGLDSRKRLSVKLYYEILVTEVAKIIWRYNKTVLETIAF